MFAVWCALALLALLPLSQTANPGVKVKLTQKGLEYGRQIGMATLQSKLKSIKLPDMSGKVKVSHIGKVKYRITGMRIVSLGLPKSTVGLVPNTGVSVSIQNAFINLRGNWRVRYRFIRTSGSFDLSVSGLSISSSIAVKSDKTGRPTVSSASCGARVGRLKVKFHGGASWLYNLFRSFIGKALRKALEKQICPRVAEAVSEMNPRLKTLNVLAKVDKYAEIEYSMAATPAVSQQFIEFGLKGEFYNIGKHQEPPFVAAPFSLAAKNTSMLYIGLSSFTFNTAGFVYHKAGALNLYITDDMIPKKSPVRLSTKTFGVLIPEIAKRFPNLMMKMLLKSANPPKVTFQPKGLTVEATGTVTAYAILANGTLVPLFILNLEASVSAQAYIAGVKVAGAVAINNIGITLGQSYVGPFQVKSLDKILLMVLKLVVIPLVNVRLQQGYPLPALGKMSLVNPQLLIQKDYMLIGTDVHFAP
ncbi:bactericidal permeability-increasing protein-like [Conger conger]|nr:bactericidal permeability-increasing protein-like [Conger conger]XP_061075353.1 bactericidal permeability-increasing protein-like [Conger conger]